MGKIAVTTAVACLLVAAVFDPADHIMHMKTPFFIAVWATTIIICIIDKRDTRVPLGLVFYVMCFSFIIPLASIFIYMLRGGSLERYDGFSYLKAYMFFTLCIPLVIRKINAIPLLSFILTLESIAIATVYLVILNNPLQFAHAAELGELYGVIAIGHRSYGGGGFNVVDFVTSPLLVIPISYFAWRCIVSKGKARLSYALLTVVNVIGMFLSGTRNNMVMSLVTVFLVFVWYSRRKAILVSAAIVLLSVVAAMKWDTISGMLSANEDSNSVKLQHLRDYGAILSNPLTLLFGQGLGARFNSTEYGYTSITELTYIDMLRSFGILLTVPLLFCLVYPFVCLTHPGRKSEHYLYLGYASYLIICITDPYLTSSSGMLFLAIVVATTFTVSPVERSTAVLAQTKRQTRPEAPLLTDS